MPSLSDQMLSGGCAVSIESVHAESILVVSGVDAGNTFLAVNEIDSDFVVNSVLGIDPRAKRVLRFRMPVVPSLESQDVVRTDDGRRWNAVRKPGNQYLTVDFELSEIVSGKDS